MSLPTIQANFSDVRVVGYSMSNPFAEFDDDTTEQYRLTCQVRADDYSAPVGGNMGSAASADVISLPVIKQSALFCHDTKPVTMGGGMIEFVRVFSMIPLTFTEYSSGTFTSEPEYKERIKATLYSTTTGDPIKTSRTTYVENPSETTVVASKIESIYTIAPLGAVIKTAQGFTVTDGDTSLSSVTWQTYSVQEEYDGGVVVATTGTVGVLEGTTMEKYLGPIYKVSTVYVLP